MDNFNIKMYDFIRSLRNNETNDLKELENIISSLLDKYPEITNDWDYNLLSLVITTLKELDFQIKDIQEIICEKLNLEPMECEKCYGSGRYTTYLEPDGDDYPYYYCCDPCDGTGRYIDLGNIKK